MGMCQKSCLKSDTNGMLFSQIRQEKAKEFNLDSQRIAVGGVSAGSHIATVISHLARDEGYPLAFQLLTVPVLDITGTFTANGERRGDCPYKSYWECEHTVALPLERMAFFHGTFLGNPRPKSLDEVCYQLPF